MAEKELLQMILMELKTLNQRVGRLEERMDRLEKRMDRREERMDRLEERGKPVAVLAIDRIPLTGSGKDDYRMLEKLYRKYDYTKWDPSQM